MIQHSDVLDPRCKLSLQAYAEGDGCLYALDLLERLLCQKFASIFHNVTHFKGTYQNNNLINLTKYQFFLYIYISLANAELRGNKVMG